MRSPGVTFFAATLLAATTARLFADSSRIYLGPSTANMGINGSPPHSPTNGPPSSRSRSDLRILDRDGWLRQPPWHELTKALAENLISSALARAQEACREDGVDAPEVFAVLVMSNHIHLVARARGNNLARFVGYFKARVAMSINLLLGRTGSVLGPALRCSGHSRRPSGAGPRALPLQNPQKAKLVRHVDEWPGFVAFAGLRDNTDDMVTTWFDWTAWHRARCPKDKRATSPRRARRRLARVWKELDEVLKLSAPTGPRRWGSGAAALAPFPIILRDKLVLGLDTSPSPRHVEER